MSVKVSFPDGSERVFEDNISVKEIADGISHSLMKKSVVAVVNDKVVDLSTKLTTDCSLKIITLDTKDAKDKQILLDTDHAYVIPENDNLKCMLEDLKTTYKNDENSICLVPSYMFCSNNYLFNKKNFNIIGVADELKSTKGKKNRTIPLMDRRANSPKRPFLNTKKLGKRNDGELFYFGDPYNVICNKKDSVDLDKIKQEDKTMNLDNISKINQIKSFTAKK